MADAPLYADDAWWQGKPDHEAPIQPANLDEAEALAWSRCWAYIEEHNLPPEVCWHIWPTVYGALDACRRATTTRATG